MGRLDLVYVTALACLIAVPASASWLPVQIDSSRPRILLRADAVPAIQERLRRQPYQTVFADLAGRITQATDIRLDDHSIENERLKARAAKGLAFEYTVDRTQRDGTIGEFPTRADRQVAGDRVRDMLLHMFTRSRLVAEPPLGGWDRDINTSEELLQWATAYDTLKGAGYDFGAAEAPIIENLVALASELYDNYVHPETASTFPVLHQNNHRSKSGAALVAAAIALAEYEAPTGTDPDALRSPALWAQYGFEQIEFVDRYVLMAGDGAYAEGPFYWRYTAQNILPVLRAWDALVGQTAGAVIYANRWRDPRLARTLRWELDMTLPDGSLAPLDDGNPGRSYYFGIFPGGLEFAPALAWRWANAPTPYETEGSVDLAADALVAFDDTLAPAPPLDATAFYIEGGNAILRRDWSPDAVVAVVQAEHDTASEFGRDKQGRGVGPQSHEHAEPGAFLLHAFGERLAMDPGYLDFGNRTQVNRPEHHNLVLVDGRGPIDYLNATGPWRGRTGRPPIDGNAMLADTLDSGFLDAATVVSRYGRYPNASPMMRRRFLLSDDRYLAVYDEAVSAGGTTPTFTWLLHGNGGADSGGTFSRLADGGVWERARARLSWVATTDRGALAFDEQTAVHEDIGKAQRSHTVLRGSLQAPRVDALHLAYPTRSAVAAPMAEAVHTPTFSGVHVNDTAELRDVWFVHFAGAAPHSLAPHGVLTDGDLLLSDVVGDAPTQRLAWVEHATHLSLAGVEVAASGAPGHIGMRLTGDRVDVVAENAAATVEVRSLPFPVMGVDGVCSTATVGNLMHVTLGRDRRFTLRATTGNARPAADPGATRQAGVGTVIDLDGSASCDADEDALEAHWELVSAPAASAWQLEAPGTLRPRLTVDAAGPFRVRLRVTDSKGAQSMPMDLLIIGGNLCSDGLDNDTDGLFDSDDPDCDAGLSCAADCSEEGEVTIDELVRAVAIALDDQPLGDCPTADADHDGAVTVDELIRGVMAALDGCR